MDEEILEFTHFNEAGRSKMVDVSEKKSTERVAIAKGAITMKKETLQKVMAGQMKKGDVLGVAQIAGIMAVKRTADLIPMCHNIFISLFMILGMVTLMSIFGIIMEGTPTTDSLLLLYGKTWALNIVVALPLQLLLVGPSSRFIFAKIYR